MLYLMATWVQDVTKERIAFCHMVSETPVRAPLGQYSNYLLQIHCSEFVVITKSNSNQTPNHVSQLCKVCLGLGSPTLN